MKLFIARKTFIAKKITENITEDFKSGKTEQNNFVLSIEPVFLFLIFFVLIYIIVFSLISKIVTLYPCFSSIRRSLIKLSNLICALIIKHKPANYFISFCISRFKIKMHHTVFVFAIYKLLDACRLIFTFMNKLTSERSVQIIKLLVKGNSIRACARIADVSKNTITKLLIEIGKACMKFHNEKVLTVKSKRIQCDEIWSFVYSKEKNKPEGMENIGDVWT